MTVLLVLGPMFSCPQSVKICFTKWPRIPSCPPHCFYCCFELLPSERFLWWESCAFQDNPLQNSLTPSCVQWCYLPCYSAPPHTHTLNTWNVPSCLLHSTEWCTCLSCSWWRILSCAGKSFAVMLHVFVIECSACIMGCSVHGCMGSVFGLCDNGNNDIQTIF